MTSLDPMPFGKYKGTPICDVPDTYKEWLMEQPGFKEKNPKLYQLFDEGDSDELSTPIERKNIDEGAALIAQMSEDFKHFWSTQYGTRLRQQGEFQYLAFLRVAITTWQWARRPAPKMMAPPLSHIPAPKLPNPVIPPKPASPSVPESNLLKQDLTNVKPAPDEDDPDEVEHRKDDDQEARLRAQGFDKDGTPLF